MNKNNIIKLFHDTHIIMLPPMIYCRANITTN